MGMVREYRRYEKPREVKAVISNKHNQIIYYCPDCGDTILVCKLGEKLNMQRFCGHCGCPIFDPVEDDIADINKKIMEY